MFKSMKTTLLIVAGLALGFTAASVTGCGSAPGHDSECDSTVVCCDTVKTDSVVVTEVTVDPASVPVTITEQPAVE